MYFNVLIEHKPSDIYRQWQNLCFLTVSPLLIMPHKSLVDLVNRVKKSLL